LGRTNLNPVAISSLGGIYIKVPDKSINVKNDKLGHKKNPKPNSSRRKRKSSLSPISQKLMKVKITTLS